MDIKAYQGETVKISVEVKDIEGNPANLTGATAQLAVRRNKNAILVKECSISETSTATYVDGILEATDTQFTGKFYYEVRVKFNNEVDTVISGTLELLPSLLPVMEVI